MSEENRGEGSRQDEKRSQDLEYRSRLERRSARRAARRRKTTAKLWRAMIPVVVVVAAVVILLLVFGGSKGQDYHSQTTVTISGPEPVEGSGLLIIEQGDGAAAAVLVQPIDGGGVILAIPGLTLLRTPTGFEDLSEIHAAGQDAVLRTALTEALGVPIGPVSSVEWKDLQVAMESAGVSGAPIEALDLEETQVAPVAEAVLSFLSLVETDAGSAAWDALILDGDNSGLRAAVSAIEGSFESGWRTSAVTGTVVKGEGYEYLDPAVAQARAVLAGITRESAIKVAVQNGSGALGVAEAAAGILGGLGYTLLPVSNAPDFPDVTVTRVTVAAGLAGDGEQIRSALGVGQVSEDPALDPDTVIVVLGADFKAP